MDEAVAGALGEVDVDGEAPALAADCRAALASVHEVAEARLGPDAPRLRALAEALEVFPAPAGALGNGRREAAGRPGADALDAPGVLDDAPPGSREEALARLVAVGRYFRRCEPLSPVSYLIERAVRWGRKSLPDWLAEMVKDEQVLQGIHEHLGIDGRGAG
jgi:type VI secretion system protein ImpA